MKASGYWTCYAIFRRLCFFPRIYLFTDLLVLHQVTELVMHLSFPNYQNWKLSVLCHFFEIYTLNEKYESIGLLNLLCYIAEIVLLSSQLFVHSFVSFASSYWTVMQLNIPKYQNWNSSVLGHFFKISSLNEKYESIGLLDLLYLSTLSKISSQKVKRNWSRHQVTEPAMLFCRFLSSQLFVHWIVSFAASYWTCYAFEFSNLSKLKFKCFGSFLQNF